MPSKSIEPLHDYLLHIREQIPTKTANPEHWTPYLAELMETGWATVNQFMVTLSETLSFSHASQLADLQTYLERFQHHLFSMQRDIELLLPWMLLLNAVPEEVQSAGVAWQAVRATLPQIPRLNDLSAFYEKSLDPWHSLQGQMSTPDAKAWCQHLIEAMESAQQAAGDLLADFEQLQHRIEAEFQGIDFKFLYNKDRSHPGGGCCRAWYNQRDGSQ